MHKGMQWGKAAQFCGYIYRFHTPQRLCATAPGEEELEKEENDAMCKMSWTLSTRWRVFT